MGRGQRVNPSKEEEEKEKILLMGVMWDTDYTMMVI
jgi:hypothetical protein